MAYCFAEDRAEPGSFHVWGKTKDGLWLFRDDEDRANFESILSRYLSGKNRRDSRGRPMADLHEGVAVCAVTLLSSHYHLILWQKVPGGIDRLMRRVIHVYTRYYHHKYGTSGSLFPGPYRARPIAGRKSFQWRVAYVHKNHKRLGLDWQFSSHRYFVTDDWPGWLEVEKTLDAFGGRGAYVRYMHKFIMRADLDEELRIDEPWL